ncbi:MAG: LemA family protein [Cyclobacteriaceae bacterium]|jgi:LemA protein
MEIVKKFWWVALLGIIVFWFIGIYNGMAGKDQVVKSAWGDVESDYQRRSDLIPNLVSTVKGYANFEQETLTKVIEARASATQVKIDASNLTPENMAAFQQAQSGLSSSLGRLLAVSENYPDLKANQNFLDLQAQLEGTENRISVSRKRFNEAVLSFNTSIVGFPRSLIAGFGGFKEKGYFKADAGAEKAPAVKF